MLKKNQIEHLEPATATWVRSVDRDFDLQGHHIRLLLLAADAWDAANRARIELEHSGEYFTDKNGSIRSHPAQKVLNDSRLAFAKMARELNLNSSPNTESRPPRIGGAA